MIPDTDLYEDDDIEEYDFDEYSDPSKTYGLNLNNNSIIGYIDDNKAIEQAVFKILSTEQYNHEIYSFDYGVQKNDLYGNIDAYVMSELKARITEALMNDDRIEDVIDFEINRSDKRSYFCKFTVVTSEQYDDITFESEVDI